MPAHPVERGSALTAWGQVLRDLRRRLDSGEFPAGARLPAESALVLEYRASRATVRRAVAELAVQGRVRTRAGSGTYASTRRDARVRLDLSLPWREQVLGAGREARSEDLADPPAGEAVPEAVAALVGGSAVEAFRDAVRRRHLVDGVPIGLVEGWSALSGGTGAVDDATRLVEHSVLELDNASREQAVALGVPVLAPLVVVTARLSLATTGEAVGVTRTSWATSRVRLVQSRTLTAGSSDLRRP
ncbi:GntR family transcriptional regulator [Rathayibacter festucae]|uniref:HTH gntR-type domain-containing protein n=1 Tax=Rathayibacter festucae DSM 15932 TaxID=1328866 RepID=A0A3Q9UXN0_9MICO|nr:GntR family transcriptional regulator [Rathayibacter festucae]AZZ51716.1 hypothetical protein C1I64_06425 [Rathayibacter festucae DSM 15932]